MINVDLLNNVHSKVHKKKFSFKKRLRKKNRLFIKNLNVIKHMSSLDHEISEASNWIMDNYVVIENEISDLLKDNYAKFREFNSIKVDNKFFSRAYLFCLSIVENQNSVFNEREFFEKLNAYDENAKFSLEEFWSIPFFLKFTLLEKIQEIVNSVAEIENQKYKGYMLFLSLVKLISKGKNKLVLKKINKIINGQINLYMMEYFISLIRKNKVEENLINDFIQNVLENENLTYEELKISNEKSLNNIRIKISMYIQSVKNISFFNWEYQLESVSSVHKEFLKDPAGIYSNMDYYSRDQYRKELESICKKNRLIEHIEAANIVKMCKEEKTNYSRHIGYYLIDEGRKYFSKHNFDKFKKFIYFLSIYLGIFSIFIGLNFYFIDFIKNKSLTVSVSVLLTIVLSDMWINFINYMFLNNIKRKFVPKMDYSKKIPDEAKTMVVIPCLLSSKKDIEKLFKNLELSYICNENENIYFSLLFDYVDTISYEGSEDKILFDFANNKLNELNNKYKFKEQKFYMFVRNKKYSESNKVYMGWERKRGKIMEFINFLKGRESSFKESLKDYPALNDIKYLITIDSDNKLKKGTACKLIGAINHVLNKAHVKKIKKYNKVIRGYGIVQPKTNISFKSYFNTVYSKLFVGNVAISSYVSEVSNIYHDLFSESIFTGKGIVDIDVFDKVLWNVIPENRVLSHDLIEGCFARVLLSSDIEIEEEFPSNILSAFSRLHRWIRGDWQLISYLIKGRGINLLSKYKILDNLRRSLVPVSFVIACLIPFFFNVRKENIYYGFLIGSILFPILLDLSSININYKFRENLKLNINNFKSKIMQAYVTFSFLPYQCYVTLDAIFKALVRLIFTKKYLLEWKSFQEVEKASDKNIKQYFQKMYLCLIFGIICVVMSIKKGIYQMILPSMLFFFAPYLAYLISKKYVFKKVNLNYNQNTFLRSISRSIFAYFEDFVNESTNYLVCDNYQEQPAIGIAKRTSPTNIGMSLSAFIVGREFAFITIFDMVEKVKKIMNSIDMLPVYRGHLYNWYDTQFVPLGNRYVSTVDSGNLLASYYLCKKSLEELLEKPIIHRDLVRSFEEMIYLCKDFEINNYYDDIIEFGYRCKNYNDYIKFLEGMVEKSKRNIYELRKDNSDVYWHIKINDVANSFLNEVINITENIHSLPNFKIEKFGEIFIKTEIVNLEYELIEFKKEYNNLSVKNDTVEYKINAVIKNVRNLINDIKFLINKFDYKIKSMDFKFLYRSNVKLLSIGYDCEKDTLDSNSYDLLASEVRIASFLSIAKGDVPIEHWFKLGRSGIRVNKIKTLTSWSGTMFEYLMPMLYMRAYPETLLYETYKGCLTSQIKFANHNKIPYGVSESGFYEFDESLNYQYKAFGIPELAIKKDFENIVISPYSCIMSSMVNIDSCLENLKSLDKLGSLGKYGFYEAIDFTKTRNNKGGYSLVKSYMSHHQGMSFLALANVLIDDVCQRRFENILDIESISELLNESISNIKIKKAVKNKDEAIIFEPKEEHIPRFVKYEGNTLPEMQMYSNGNYSLGISSSGGGYLKYNNEYITNFTRDFTNETPQGSIYIRDLKNEEFFSNTYLPCKNEKLEYFCDFQVDKVTFTTSKEDISVITDVILSKNEDVEIKKVVIKNLTSKVKHIELTSYFESPVLNKNFDFESHKKIILCGNEEENLFMGQSVYSTDGSINNVEFENTKEGFIGLEGNVKNPICMGVNSNYGNNVFDDDLIMSLRFSVKVDVYSNISIYFINAVHKNKEKVIELIEKYKNPNVVQDLYCDNIYYFKNLANNLKLSSREVALFNHMTSRILYGFSNKEDNVNFNADIKDLICHSIDYKTPIVAVEIKSLKDLKNIEIIMKAFVYFSKMSLNFNLIILNSYVKYDKQLDLELDKLMLKYDVKTRVNVNNGIYVVLSNLYKNTYDVIRSVANIFVESSEVDIYQQLGFSISDCSSLTDKSRAENVMLLKDDKNIKITPNIIFGKYLFETSSEIFELGSIDKYDIPKRALKFYNSYGGFSKTGSEYIIKLDNLNRLSYNYRNILKNEHIATVVFSNGLMSTWAYDCKEFLITKEIENSYDNISEAIYIKENENVWSPLSKPINNKEEYIVSNSSEFTKVKNSYNDLKTEVKCYVPENKKYKVIKISIKNLSKKSRKLDIYYFAPIILGSNNDYTKKLSTFINDDFEYIYGENKFSKDFKNVKAYLKLFGCENISFTGSKIDFLGLNRGCIDPIGLYKEKLSNFTGVNIESCLSTMGNLEINKGETKEVYILLGYDNSIEEINCELSDFYDKLSYKKEEKEEFIESNNRFKIKTKDEHLDVLFNDWIVNQNNVEKFLLSSTSKGHLNSCVDFMEKCFVYNYTNPEESKKNIIKVFSNMYKDGSFKDKWSNLTNEYEVNYCLYDLLWIVYGVIDYIKVTNDFELLDFKIKYMNKESDIEFTTIYNKCLKIISNGLNLDSKNVEINKSIVDVSTLFMLYKVLDEFKEICLKFDDSKFYELFYKVQEDLSTFLKKNCFNGEFYIKDLNYLNSKEFYNHIYLLPQVLSLLCFDYEEENSKKVLMSIEKYLVNKQGMYIKESFRKDRGFTKELENIQDNKVVILLIKALAKYGLSNKAHLYLNYLNPILKTINRNQVNSYKCEPYVVPSKIQYKENKIFKIINKDFNYLSSLMYRIIIEDIIGVTLCSDGFYINPCIPDSWDTYVIEYKLENCFYKIIVRKGSARGIKIDGKKHVEKFIKFDHNEECVIDITI